MASSRSLIVPIPSLLLLVNVVGLILLPKVYQRIHAIFRFAGHCANLFDKVCPKERGNVRRLKQRLFGEAEIALDCTRIILVHLVVPNVTVGCVGEDAALSSVERACPSMSHL